MRYAVARDVAWHAHRVPGEAFPTVYAMACPDGQPYVLAGTSALIWQALVDGEVGLVGTLAGEFDQDPDVVAAAIEQLMSDLAASGLVTPRDR